MKTRNLTLVFACLFLLFSGCSSKKDKKIAPPPAPVKTSYAQMKDIPFYIDTIGHFVAFNTVTIQAQVQGELTGLYFKEGQEVQQGDLLFTIDSKPYQAVLDKTVAMLRQNEALYAYNKSRADRYSQLVGDDFVSVLDYEQYVSEMKNYDALINQDIADIESAEINVGYCTLAAPIAGVTGKRLVDVGNIITDVGSELLVINQIDPMFIDFSIPERFFDIVFQNQKKAPLKVELFVPNTPLKANACLEMLDNTVNQKTGMIAARGILENNAKHFWPQQFVRVRLIVYMMNDSIMVPNGSIIPGPNGQLVWVVDSKNEVHPIDVKIGEQYEGQTQVISGLKEGDQVVTYGQLGLVKGRKVVISKDKGENY